MEQKLSNGVQTDDFYTEYQNKKDKLAVLMSNWETLAQELEN